MDAQTTKRSVSQPGKPAGNVARPNRSGWQREYETIFLMPSDVTDEASDKINEKMRELVASAGGRVIKFTTWGRRKTAFEVKRQGRALFVHMAYLGSGKTVSEVERNLRNLEEIEKFITTLVNPFVDPAARPTEQDVKMSGDIDERPAAPVRPEGAGDDMDFQVPDLNNVGE